jgi:hypothetical protein
MDLEGNLLLVPFPEFEGGDLVIASIDKDSSDWNIRVRSSSDDRSLDGTIIMEKDLLRSEGVIDIFLRDTDGNILGVPIGMDNSPPVFTGPDDVVYNGLQGDLAVADVTGDDIPDLLHLADGGRSLEFMEGPHPTNQGKASLPLPLKMDHIESEMDLTGDGISEIVLWNSTNGNSTVLIYHGLTLTPMAILDHDREIRDIKHGDMDGDGIDDILLIAVTDGGLGRMDIMPGSGISFNTEISSASWKMEGNSSLDLNRIDLLVRDIDGDRIDDLIMGYPDHDGSRGKVLVQYGSHLDIENDTNWGFDPSIELVGGEYGDGLGKSLFVVDDLDGDLLPDLFTGTGNGLSHVATPSNRIPDMISDLRFFDFDVNISLAYAEEGDIIGIRCRGEGGHPDTADILVANITTSREQFSTVSWTYLKETGDSTGIFTGSIHLADGSIPGRSIGVVQNDVLNLSIMSMQGRSILVRGFAGQEDPPFLIEGKEKIKVMEDSPVNETLVFIDPDDDPVSLEMTGKPSWLQTNTTIFENGTYRIRLEGTPTNRFVGWNNFTILARSGDISLKKEISVLVLNRDPIIKPLDVPSLIDEGSNYRAIFDLGESGEEVSSNLSVEGSNEIHWLDIRPSGEVFGTPANKDVGNWTFNLTVEDGNGGIDWFTWDVEVRNIAPDLSIPNITEVMEKEPVTLDFGTRYENDGLTSFMIRISGWKDPVRNEDGKVEILPDITSNENISIEVRVEDGNGAFSNGSLEIRIINSPAVLLNPEVLIDRMIAGTVYSFDLESDEEGEKEGDQNRFHYIFSDDDILGNNPDSTIDGRFEIRPWNIDAGNHSVKIALHDWNNADPTIFFWNFTVLEDLGFDDPYLDLEILGRKGSKVVVDIEFGGDLPFLQIVPGLKMTDDGGVSNTLFNMQTGDPVEIEMENIEGRNATVVVHATIENTGTQQVNQRRELEATMEFDPDSLEDLTRDRNGSRLPMIIIIFVIITLSAMAGVSLFIERTSYPIRSMILPGGKLKEEEVMSLIQDKPGIGFHELLKTGRIPMRDMVTTLEHLERNGRARAVVDGPWVRFLPMMGSFVDGPLSLNRFQKMILEVLLKGGKLRTEEISEATGYPLKKTIRELKMLELKGAVRSSGNDQLLSYQLTRRQKLRMRE